MKEQNRQVSRLIDALAKSVAEWTLARLEESGSLTRTEESGDDRNMWLGTLHARLQHLSQAVAVEESHVFLEDLRWTEHALRAHGGISKTFHAAINSMRTVIEENLPIAAHRPTLQIFDTAVRLWRSQKSSKSNSPGPPDRTVLLFLEAVISGDRTAARDMAFQQMQIHGSLGHVYMNLLQPAMVEVGGLWHSDSLSVAEEHAATAMTQTIMAVLHDRAPRTPSNGRTVLTACVGGELHSLGIRMVADLFDVAGWKTVHLGANTPAAEVIQTLLAQRVDLLAISGTSPLFLREAAELIEAVRMDDRTAHIPVLIGGAPFHVHGKLWRQVGADAFAESAVTAVEVGSRLVAKAPRGEEK